MNRGVFVFDKNKCVGCEACIIACANENNQAAHNQWRKVLKPHEPHLPEIPVFHLSLACNHCEKAPCLYNCPASAYQFNSETGSVIHDENHCIGCKYCTWVCPFNAPVFKSEKGTVEKCSQCIHRLEENLKPACAALCPTGALDFCYEKNLPDDLKNHNDWHEDIRPGIRTRDLRQQSGPEMDTSLFSELRTDVKGSHTASTEISALKEWPLVIFTFICAVVVSLVSSGFTTAAGLKEKIIITGILGIAGSLSSSHLGKKERAYRAVLNIRSSWLSREIVFFTLFMLCLCTDFFLINIPDFIILLSAILLLFSIDKLYSTAFDYLSVHSSQTLIITLHLSTLLMNMSGLFTLITFLRLFLIIQKESELNSSFKITYFARILCLLAPCFLISAYPVNLFLILFFTMGELIGRILFYNQLVLPDIRTELNSHSL